MADLFRPMGTVTAFKDIGLPSSTRPRGISRQSFLVYLLDLRIRVTVAFLDFVTLSPLILRIRLGIKFLFVRLRFRYPFFSPAPRDTNLGSRFRVRRQLRPGGLSPQTDGMPVIPKKKDSRKRLPFRGWEKNEKAIAEVSIDFAIILRNNYGIMMEPR